MVFVGATRAKRREKKIIQKRTPRRRCSRSGTFDDAKPLYSERDEILALRAPARPPARVAARPTYRVIITKSARPVALPSGRAEYDGERSCDLFFTDTRARRPAAPKRPVAGVPVVLSPPRRAASRSSAITLRLRPPSRNVPTPT